nr:sigma factor-like helix-turn-helix DNA-binding protein [Marinicella sp. W31]MDC2878951.1 sigma factor-like helix-turn-helix DNA-binding protein [Marinicella sp. W31]
MALPAKPRQAFLLISLESFSHAETATILEVEPDVISGLVDDASAEIARQVATDIMIIEDETSDRDGYRADG